MTASLEDVQEPHQIAVDVCARIRERIADPSLGGQVDHALRTRTRKKTLEAVPIGEVQPVKLEPGAAGQSRQARLFKPDIVVVVDAVEADHMVPTRDQALSDVIADEPRNACKQDLHLAMLRRPNRNPQRHDPASSFSENSLPDVPMPKRRIRVNLMKSPALLLGAAL